MNTSMRRCRRFAAAVGVALAASAGVVTSTDASAGASKVDALPLGSMYHVVDQIGARALWSRGYTGRGINVAVIDTGVARVDALRGADKVVAMVDLSAEAHVPEATYLDTYGHGTHMAGIIAGRDPEAKPSRAAVQPERFLGVAPDAGLVSVKVGDNSGAVDVSQVIAGIDWVIEHADELDIRVLNLSFSSDSLQTYATDPLTHAVERAWRAGIVVVVSAGNDGLGELRLGVPANDPFVIAVGGLEATAGGGWAIPDWATNGNGLRNPDIGAPGAHIDSLRAPGSRIDLEFPQARVGDDLFRGSGSSQAAAVTSGAIALLLDARPNLRPDQVKALLTRSADRTGLPRDAALYAGKGLLRIDRALSASSAFSTQLHVPATGLGSLDGARGSVQMIVDGTPLVGETTVLGDLWTGALWTGNRWADAVWDGNRWANGTWRGNRWAAAVWTGNRWAGNRWAGVDWAGNRWAGEAWSSTSWTGAHWDGNRWAGNRWAGNRWAGSGWDDSGGSGD